MLTALQRKFISDLVVASATIAKIPVPAIHYTVKGRVAGRGGIIKGVLSVDFNEAIAKENFKAFANTVVHEVAHCVDYVRNGNKFRINGRGRIFHDKVFKSIMQEIIDSLNGYGDLGTPATHHEYDVAAHTRRQRRWEYVCNSCEKQWKISTVLHNRIQKGEMRICNCKSSLGSAEFTGVQL